MEQHGGPIFGPEGEQFNVYDSAKSWNIPYKLGTRLMLEDGRQYVFGRVGAVAAVAGRLYQSEVPDADHDTLAVPASANNVIGSRTLTATNGADVVEANLYAQGFAVIEAAAGAGDGFLYKIADSHPELAGSVDIDIPLAAGAGLQTALNTSDTVTLIKHPLADVIIHPSPPTAAVIGVAAAAIPAGDFGWFQVKGVCAVLIDGTVVIGDSVMPSDAVDGAVEAWILTEGTPNAEIAPNIGQVVEVAPTTGLGAILLNIPGF